jgi:hypothetical protein
LGGFNRKGRRSSSTHERPVDPFPSDTRQAARGVFRWCPARVTFAPDRGWQGSIDNRRARWSGELVDARRTEPAYGLAERPMLEAWLEFHRATLQLKCEGLDAARLAARARARGRRATCAAAVFRCCGRLLLLCSGRR